MDPLCVVGVRVDRRRRVGRERRADVARQGRSVEAVPPRRPADTRRLPSRSEARLGMVRPAAAPRGRSTSQPRPPRPGPAGIEEAPVHPRHPQRGRPARARREPGGPEAPRRHLDPEVHLLRVRVARRAGAAARAPPRCPCGGLARPGVVWFGEPLPREAWRAAEEAATRSDLLLVVGTSAVVYPAAGLVPKAKGAGVRLVEVNVEDIPLSSEADCALRGLAGDILPALVG